MAEFPALPFWTDAYLADTGHLTNEEHGLYLRLLILLWRSPGQRIPNDEKWIERRFRDDAAAVLRLCREFCQCGEWITQNRLSREFQYLAEQSEKQREKAKLRWNKVKDLCRGNAPTPTPTPTPTKIDDDTSAKAPLIKKEAFEIADELTKIVGHDPEFPPPAWHGAAYKVQTWISGGWSRDAIITSAKIQMAARGKRHPPSSAQYFEKGIADFIAQQSNPLPEGVNGSLANGENRNGTAVAYGYAARGNRGQTRDDVILAGMGRIARRMARDRDMARANKILSDERSTTINNDGTPAARTPVDGT